MTPLRAQAMIPVLTLFGQGIPLQFRADVEDDWVDCDPVNTDFEIEGYWRRKPAVNFYRVALFKTGDTYSLAPASGGESVYSVTEASLEQQPSFVRWLSSAQTFEIEVPV